MTGCALMMEMGSCAETTGATQSILEVTRQGVYGSLVASYESRDEVETAEGGIRIDYC